MSWFVLSIICFFGWGLADLFYRMGSDENDRDSHLKIAVWVGLVMGVAALILLPQTEMWAGGKPDLSKLFSNGARYLPASLSYILSMIIGYAGLRYLELSIISPVQNASGAFSAVAMFLFFLFTGRLSRVSDAFSPLDLLGAGCCAAGLIALAIVEKRQDRKKEGSETTVGREKSKMTADGEKTETTAGRETRGSRNTENSRFRNSALALIFPLAYCLFDTVGTAADGILLSEESGMDLSELDVLVIYGLTFFLVGILCYIILWIRNKKPYRLFQKSERPKFLAALFEEFGQIFYVYAMAARPMLAAPLVSSYCILSVLLARIVLKEKLSRVQYACIFCVILGIVLLGISEGLAE